MRLLLLFVVLAAIVLMIFFIWGDAFTSIFSEHGSVVWLTSFGAWAWLAGIILLMGDLLLPLPATVIMSALGYVYGPLGGGLIGGGGSFLAGAAGYWLCRMIGERAATFILGSRDYNQGKQLARKEIGAWIVVLSRWLPVFPEVIACMAGLTRMNSIRFHVALLCGSVPMGFVYAYIGYSGLENPGLALALSAAVPALIWFLVGRVLKGVTKNH
ncbi:MAG TPA: VTT domain-containing protein [Chryseosolibacter sp.]|nr:VTT domain-containing protein [Chryseosolibacter sp.]